MKAEQKLQMDVIKGNQIYYAEFDKFTLITDGHVGVYLNPHELKIDKSKMLKAEKADFLNPEYLKDKCADAAVTNTAYKGFDGFCLKIISKVNEEYCFVKEKYLKMFSGYGGVFIQSQKDPVFITKYGIPYGIILPIHIGKPLD